MIGIDVSALRARNGGVRRMVESWIQGVAEHSRAFRDAEPVQTFNLRFRPALARAVHASGVRVFLSPWQAFPRVRVPVVVTVHELPFVRWGPIEGRLRAAVHRHWLRRDVREAAAIVVPSNATRDDLLSLHPDAGHLVHVVPHAFDPTPWRAAAESRAGRPFNAKPYALAVGASSRRKGMDVLADAKRRLDGFRVVVIGSPPNDVRRRLVSAGVEVVPPVDDAELARWIAGACLLVHPSRSEGFGFPPLEAMAAGVPVVATTGGSMSEICFDAAVLVAPGDTEALADAMIRVRDEPPLRTQLVAAGRLRADAFPRVEMFRRLLKVVGDVAGSRT